MHIEEALPFSRSRKRRHDNFFIPTIVNSQITPVPVSDNLFRAHLPQAYIVIGVVLVAPAIGIQDRVEIYFSGNVEYWESLPNTKSWVNNGKCLCGSLCSHACELRHTVS